MLAVVLDQESQRDDPANSGLPMESIIVENVDDGDDIEAVNSDTKSISSYLGNFVGSFNSNSTLTTNYGGGPRRSESATSMNKMSILSSSKESTRPYFPLNESRLVKADDLAPTNGTSEIPSEVSPKDFNSLAGYETNQTLPKLDKAISGGESLDVASSSLESTSSLRRKPSQLAVGSQNLKAIDIKSSRRTNLFVSTSPDVLASEGSLFRHTAISSSTQHSSPSRHAWPIPGTSTDLDDENLVGGNVASYSSSGPLGAIDRFSSAANSVHSGPRMRPSFLSHRSSLTSARSSLGAPRPGFHMLQAQPVSSSLEKVDEFSIASAEPKTSELTKAIKNNFSFDQYDESSAKPWSLINMLEKAVTYANDQGDLVMCSTLILLFHDLFKANFAKKVLSDQGCLECLGLYIETLRKKCLFTNAVNVVKEAPSSFKYKLSVFASKEVDMRYYCCWCEKLLVNEVSKEKFGPASEKFGYWYCDNCSRQQLCCIYCNEPSRGLSVVVGLNCGHKGHFGCLQEWFVDEGHTECPGGCEYSD